MEQVTMVRADGSIAVVRTDWVAEWRGYGYVTEAEAEAAAKAEAEAAKPAKK